MATEIDVATRIGQLAKLYGQEKSADTVVFFVDVLLRRLSPDEACEAISRWAEKETRFPAPAALIQLIKPSPDANDEATEMSMRLSTLIARRGYTWESTYRYDGYASIDEAITAEAGPLALDVVRRCGGWAAFCREWGKEEGNTAARAQLRGVCHAIGGGAGRDNPAIAGRSVAGFLDPFGIEQDYLDMAEEVTDVVDEENT